MDEYTQIIKDQLAIIPKELRDFVIKGDWGIKVSDISKGVNLTENQSSLLENEVLMILIGLELVVDFKDNIRRELNISNEIVEKIDSSIKSSIFNQTNSEINIDTELKPKERQSNVGNSFEENILSQAKAMMPAVPENLPSEESAQNKFSSYGGEKDPYRETV